MEINLTRGVALGRTIPIVDELKSTLMGSFLGLVSADARLRRESVIVGDDGKWTRCEAQLRQVFELMLLIEFLIG